MIPENPSRRPRSDLSRCEFFFTRAEAKQMNIRFAQAMLDARKRGDEQFRLGVIIDTSPLMPTHYSREVSGSLMSSSGAACAEFASCESIPERAIPAMSARGGR